MKIIDTKSILGKSSTVVSLGFDFLEEIVIQAQFVTKL